MPILNSKSNAFHPIPLHTIDGVMKRSWDGGTNMKLGTDLQATLEGYDIYGDNASSAQRISNSKINTYHALANDNNSSIKKYVPTTYTFPNQNELTQRLQSAIDALCSEAEANKDLDKTQHPVIVLKYDEGTHGNGLQFFKADEVEQLKAQIVKSEEFTPFVLQTYIRPKAFNSAIKNQAFSSHYRIIFSKAGLDPSSTYQFIGGIHFQRKGSWCSNSHNSEGELSKRALAEGDLTEDLREALSQAGEAMGLNQFGADVIIDTNGRPYILELNDGMGISGEILESQGVAKSYVDSFIARVALSKESQPAKRAATSAENPPSAKKAKLA